jgi:hypothetical protein
VFHPLAYLVKLNIEMSMARLIKKIALGSENPNNAAGFRSFNSSSLADKAQKGDGSFKSWAAKQSASLKNIFNGDSASVQQGGIQKTEEFTVRSAPREEVEMQLQQHAGDKSVQVGVSSVIGASDHPDFKESKGSRTKEFMSDEETLIQSQPPLSPFRRSTDSSAKASDVSVDPRASSRTSYT